ncbi:MFS transporter [Curtobacterium sp. MCLR17_007]|uniref:MFS transporter n=1 Tax=Curtobacterium sp. MCLR17_007 TaxID=2175648 RepID=UPI000DA7CA70|nr:MFS transporter [Curtobacterium sp. MCLR17_007]WIB58886.1 MFS transporter [Curtobacterium sp. MCLR17_007]
MATARTLISSAPKPFRSATARYRDVLGRPGARAFFIPAGLARLGVAMTGLGLLFSVQNATGSFAAAGTATATFAIAEAVAGPQVARLVDRWGQAVTVPVVVLVHAAAIAAAISFAGIAPISVTLAAVVVAGGAMPQPGALAAARWSALVTEPAALRTAFSLEASVNDVVFLSGPVLVTLASTTLVPWAGSVAAVTLVSAGCAALALHRSTGPPARPARGRAAGRTRSSLRAPRFLAVLGVNLGLGCFFGAVPLLVTATATAGGLRPLTGFVLALSSAASMVAGLGYGALRTTPRPTTVQLLATILLTVGVLVAVVWPTLLGLSVMLVVGGSAVAPLLASSSQIVQATVVPSERTQAFTWINSASASGIALGAALTGTVVATSGTQAATTLVLVLVLTAVAAAVLAARRNGAWEQP